MASARTINKDDNFYKRVLHRSHQRFLEDFDPVSILDLFLEKEYLTYTHVRDIQEQRLTSDKTREILKAVSSRGASGYKKFRSLLVNSNQGHLAEYLDKQEAALEKGIKMTEKEKRFTHVQTVDPPKATVVTESALVDVVGCIGNNWEMLGPFLGVSSTYIQQIKMSLPGQTATQIYNMLFTWKNGTRNATVDNLLAALHKAPTAVHINWSGINDINFTRHARSGDGNAESARNSAGPNRSGDQPKSSVNPNTDNVIHAPGDVPIYPARQPSGLPGQANLARPNNKAESIVTDYFPPTGTVTRGESNLPPLGAGGSGECSSETIHSSLFPNAFGNTRKQGKDESNLQAVDKSYSMNSPDGPMTMPQNTTAGNSVIHSRQPQGENRNATVGAVRNYEAENNDVQDQHGERPSLPDQPNLGAPRNYAQAEDGNEMVEKRLEDLRLTKSGNQPSGSSNVTAVVQRSADSRQNDETDARGEFTSIPDLVDGELSVKREKLKPGLPAAPHDGRLLTPSVRCLQEIIDHSVTPIQKGGFGDVFFHKDRIRGLNIPAVVKRINCQGCPKHKMMSVTNERLASRTMHFSIVPLLAMTEDVQNNTFYFLTPYLEKGDLADAIKNDTSKINDSNDDVMLKSGDRVRILYQINSALHFLHTPVPGFRVKQPEDSPTVHEHSMNILKDVQSDFQSCSWKMFASTLDMLYNKEIIVHMDLKTLNIVLDCNLNARLIDFGLAREMNETATSLYVTATEVPGTKGYYQTIRYDRLTPKEDYHNFGIVIRELLTGKPAYDENNPKEELRKQDKENINDDIQSIWYSGMTPSKAAEDLNDIAEQCIEKDIDSKDIGEQLEGFLRTIGCDKWNRHELTANEDYARCEMCMANPAVNTNMPNVVHGHKSNCRCHMLVCIACMRNSFLNPMMCHSCGAKLTSCIGYGWGAVIIAGNDTEDHQLANIFSEEISDIHNVVVSKCPLVMGISEDNIKVVKPTKPGESDKMLERVDNAFDELARRGDIHTLLIYYSGHHYANSGFLLGSKEEFLSVDSLKARMKKIAESYSQKDARSEHISKIRFMVFLDCCAAPKVTLPKLIDDTDFSILQMNSSRSNQSAQADEIIKGSVFTKFFIQALTRCAMHKNCINDNCTDCNCLKGEYITAEQLFEYIAKHMAVFSKQKCQQPVLQPVKHEQGILWHDLIIGYNIDFRVDLEFKVKGYEGKQTVAQQIYTDMPNLRTHLFEKLMEKMKPGQQFDLNQLTDFAECVCIEIDRGPKETEELDSIEKVMAAWNSRRELIVSLRVLDKIHRGIVWVETPVADVQTFIEQLKPTTEETEVLIKLKLPFSSIDNIIKDLKYSKDSVLMLRKNLVHIRQGVKNAKAVVKDDKTELHFIFPKPLAQREHVNFMCFQVTGLKEKPKT